MGFMDFFGGGSRMQNIFSQPIGQATDDEFDPLVNRRTGKRFQTGVGPGSQKPSPFASLFQAPEVRDTFAEQMRSGPPKADKGPEIESPYEQMLRSSLEPGQAMNEFREGLRNTPNYANYKPSGWRIALASGAGAAAGLSGGAAQGAQLAEHINMTPYKRAMDQYQMEMQGKAQAAELEQKERANKATVASQLMGRDIDERRLMQTGQKNRWDQLNEQYKMGQKDDEIELARLRLNQPDYIMRDNKDGTTSLYNKKNINEPPQVIRTESLDFAKFQETQDANKKTQAYQRGMLGVAGRNASTAERNAATNEGQLDETVAEHDVQAQYRQDQMMNEYTSPDNVGKARDLALEYLRNDPAWSMFVKQGDKAKDEPLYMEDPSQADDTTMYKEFKRQLEGMTNYFMFHNKQSPGGGRPGAQGDTGPIRRGGFVQGSR